MAGYIGSKSSVTQVDGYTEAEADAEFVNDPNGAITVSGSNVGIGVVPESSYPDRPVLRIGSGLGLMCRASGNPSHTWINSNAYQDPSSADDKYIGTDEASQIRQTNGSIHFMTAASGSANATINWTNAMSVMKTGGITFNGDTAAANALNDYEEGSFTPVYAISGGSVTTGTNGGRYVKVGSFVFFTFKIRTTAVSGTGVLSMTLPFATASENRSGGSKGYARDWGVDMPEFSIYTPPNSSVVLFYRHAMNASTAQAVTGSQMGTGSDDNVLEGSIVYKSA